MATNVGTLDISYLLDIDFQSVAEYGMDTIQEVLARDLAVHNTLMQDLVGSFCEITVDRQRIYGTSIGGEMYEVDEYGRAPTQREKAGSTVGFPLRLYQYAIGWTRKWFQVHTPRDMALAINRAQKSDLMKVQLEVRKSLFNDTNYTFNDFLIDKVDLSVKRLVNADGAPIPDGPNGETFDGSTHDHYLATASLVQADVVGLINTVVEHGHATDVRVYINKAQEAAVRAFTDFEAYKDPRIIYVASDVANKRLDITRLDNRAIGILSAAEVWVKPWVPAGYMFCFAAGDPNKPLAFRQRDSRALQGLRIAGEIEMYPLLAEYMEHEFGIGVWTRTNGAALYIGGASWVNPSL